MRVDVIGKHLADSNLGTIGTDLFLFAMPAACEEGVLIKLPLAGVSICHELPDYYRSHFQVIVRSKTHAAGDAKASAIAALLTIERPVMLDDGDGEPALMIGLCLPRHKPIVYPRSDGAGLEFSLNFDISCVEL